MTIRDLGKRDDLELITNSQDIKTTLEHIGYKGALDDYGCLLVQIWEGELIEVWGCIQSIPHLDYSIDKLL